MKPLEAEEAVRKKLEQMYGTRFRRARLMIGYKSKREPQIHEFDLVSEDNSIIGEIKSGRWSSNNYNLALVDCFYLSKVKARVKLMIFTHKELYEHFKTKSSQLISSDIQPILINAVTAETLIPR